MPRAGGRRCREPEYCWLKYWVRVSGALGGFGVREGAAVGRDRGPVDVALVAGDVEAAGAAGDRRDRVGRDAARGGQAQAFDAHPHVVGVVVVARWVLGVRGLRGIGGADGARGTRGTR